MKRIIVIFLLIVFALPCVVKGQEEKRFLYERKIISFAKMKQTGIGLTFGGALLSIGGIAVMANSNLGTGYIDSYGNSRETERWMLGYLALCLGVPTTAGGIVFWSIGGSKMKKYQEKLNSVSLNLNPSPQQAISLSVRF